MHFITAATFALSAASTALSAVLPGGAEVFQLHASGNDALEGWAVLTAHVGAGTDAIVIQRPLAYTSTRAILTGTKAQEKKGEEILSFRK
jgi:hypothetical protein